MGFYLRVAAMFLIAITFIGVLAWGVWYFVKPLPDEKELVGQVLKQARQLDSAIKLYSESRGEQISDPDFVIKEMSLKVTPSSFLYVDGEIPSSKDWTLFQAPGKVGLMLKNKLNVRVCQYISEKFQNEPVILGGYLAKQPINGVPDVQCFGAGEPYTLTFVAS